jgi:hypothetical protein
LRDSWGNRFQAIDFHDESLIWLLPYREVQKAGIAFRTKCRARPHESVWTGASWAFIRGKKKLDRVRHCRTTMSDAGSHMPNLAQCEHGVGAHARVMFFDINSRFDQPEKSL